MLTVAWIRMSCIEFSSFIQYMCYDIVCEEALIVIMSLSRDRSCSQSGSNLAKCALR